MLANNNLKICLTLVRRDFRFHRAKNWILILAAALVTGLYAFVFLLGSSVEGAYLLNYQYTYGSASHILYTGLTEGQADMLSQNINVKSSVRLSTVGQLSDEALGQRSVKLAVTDREYAESVLSVPATGRLPQAEGEIALDEFTMDSLGISRELGAPVTLRWTDQTGQVHTSEFTLCGWWASPTNFTEACAWITSETASMLAPDYNGENARSVTLGVTLHQPGDLEAQAEQILSEQGVSGAGYTTNLAYNNARKEQAEANAMPYYYPAGLVLICGFMMIYSIVHVAADKDNLFFASLKALGMTPRQLRRFLLEQGLAVWAAGLIPGFLIGFLLHLAITSRIVAGMEQNPALYFLDWKPFALAAVCTVVTVVLAYLLPAVRLSRMTPAQTMKEKEGRGRISRPGDGRVTIMDLALRTLGREKGRTLFSAGALLLALLLLSSIWIQYVSFREDIYIAALSPWDYTLTDGSAYLSVQRYNSNNRGITDETIEELKQRPEVALVSAVKTKEVRLTASDELRRRLSDYYNSEGTEAGMTRREEMAGYPDWTEGLERLEETGEYTGVVVSIEGEYLDYLVENLPFNDGGYDAELFQQGGWVLTSGANAEGLSSLAAGETVEIEGKTLEVMGALADNGSILSGSNSREAAFCLYYFVSPQDFEEMFPDQPVRQAAVNIDHSRQEEFEAYLDEYEQSLNRGMRITRRSEYQENFENARLNTVLPELIVSLVLMGIALVNFMNLLAAKTVSRRREFAVYESLGMTQTQLKGLLVREAVLHAAFIALTVGPATLLFDIFIMPAVVLRRGSWCMVYSFSAAPLWLVLLVVTALSLLIPLACLRFVAQGTIQERLSLRYSEGRI